MIRDPRDQLISLASTSLKDPLNRDQSLEETLLDLLTGTERKKPWETRHGACDLVWSIGIVEFFNDFLRWTKEPNFLVVRFENLIGEEGGGTKEAQIKEIRKIVAHLGVTVSEERIQYVVDNLYGQTRTFKKGQARSFERYFTPKVKQAFKKVPGACQLLIDLGYENDSNW